MQARPSGVLKPRAPETGFARKKNERISSSHERHEMKKTIRKYAKFALAACAALMLAGCAGVPILVGLGSGAVLGHEYAKEKRNCPYCDKKISRKAPVCPHCGNEVQPILTEQEKQQLAGKGTGGDFINPAQ